MEFKRKETKISLDPCLNFQAIPESPNYCRLSRYCQITQNDDCTGWFWSCLKCGRKYDDKSYAQRCCTSNESTVKECSINQD